MSCGRIFFSLLTRTPPGHAQSFNREEAAGAIFPKAIQDEETVRSPGTPRESGANIPPELFSGDYNQVLIRNLLMKQMSIANHLRKIRPQDEPVFLDREEHDP
ncbi:MAG: hypothetical protein MJ014_04210 [Methanocorpusculum sp.]|nr:hypothetical protein [Methanocorpusculum sp.]